jgi:hypothetical protein
MLKMHENPAEILVVFFQPVIQFFDLWLCQEAQYALLELARTLTRDYLYERNPLLYGFRDDAVQFGIYHRTFIEALMQVEYEFSHRNRLQDWRKNDYWIRLYSKVIGE